MLVYKENILACIRQVTGSSRGNQLTSLSFLSILVNPNKEIPAQGFIPRSLLSAFYSVRYSFFTIQRYATIATVSVK